MIKQREEDLMMEASGVHARALLPGHGGPHEGL